MRKRKLGTSNLQISEIVFGAMPLGGWLYGGTQSDRSDAVRTIHAAIDAGMTTIDTAPIYGFGLSEEIVGDAIRDRRNSVEICTKAGMRWDRSDGQHFFNTTHPATDEPVKIYRILKGDAVIEECERSLKRLGVDTIDLYQCHWPDDTTPLGETMEAMIRLREQGKIREIGVSNFTPDMIGECLETAPIVCDQPRYSPLFREIEDDILPYVQERNVSLIVYNPLEMGLLTGTVTMERTFPDTDQRSRQHSFQPENRRKVLDALDKLSHIRENHDATTTQVIVNWVKDEPGITAAIVGGRSIDQVRENAASADFVLTTEERTKIRRVFEAFQL
jgi:aryl-alcohol dehydrogenase-like predicted oxidoreductase